MKWLRRKKKKEKRGERGLLGLVRKVEMGASAAKWTVFILWTGEIQFFFAGKDRVFRRRGQGPRKKKRERSCVRACSR